MHYGMWRARGRHLDCGGIRVFAFDTGAPGGRRDAPVLVILHGYPTSSLDFESVLPSLADHFRVILHDHPGFGLSEKPVEYSYSLMEQAEIAAMLWTQLGIQRAHLLAHDYGTSVATELLARRERLGLPIHFESVTLCNGSVHIELAHLSPIQRLLANSSAGPLLVKVNMKKVFRRQMAGIWGQADTLSDDIIDAMWEDLCSDHGLERLPAVSGYLHERKRFWYRWIGALTRLDLPVHVLWGNKDPIAVPDIALRLANEIPNARLTWLEGVGHYPMIEAPELFSDAVVGYCQSV